MKACYFRKPIQSILTICEYLMPITLITSITAAPQAMAEYAPYQPQFWGYCIIALSGIWIMSAWLAWARFSWNFDVFESINEQQLFQPNRLHFQPRTWVLALALIVVCATYYSGYSDSMPVLALATLLEFACIIQIFCLSYLTTAGFLIKREIRRYDGFVKYLTWELYSGQLIATEAWCRPDELSHAWHISELERMLCEQRQKLFR